MGPYERLCHMTGVPVPADPAELATNEEAVARWSGIIAHPEERIQEVIAACRRDLGAMASFRRTLAPGEDECAALREAAIALLALESEDRLARRIAELEAEAESAGLEPPAHPRWRCPRAGRARNRPPAQ